MIDAFVKALSQILSDPAMWKLALLSVVLAVLVFGGVWLGVGFLLTHTALVDAAWLETTLDVLGGLATLALTWVLFPTVVSATVGIFLERAAATVEKRHYPELPEAPGIGFFAGLGVTLRFLIVLIVLNALLLFVLIVPPVYPVMFYVVNGYLIGREYYELVALRRMDASTARTLRKQRSLGLIVFGIVVALLLTVPLVNLFAPILGTAAMVHLFQRWRARASTP